MVGAELPPKIIIGGPIGYHRDPGIIQQHIQAIILCFELGCKLMDGSQAGEIEVHSFHWGIRDFSLDLVPGNLGVFRAPAGHLHCDMPRW
jgi:hypothetical protein